MDDVVMDKCIIGVSQVTSGTVIALAFSDGSLELRDRYVSFSPAREYCRR